MQTIKLNGETHTCELPMTVATLLESLGMAGKPVVVELNEEAVFPREYELKMVEASARVEIVALAAGG